jgi:hypothetical protein
MKRKYARLISLILLELQLFALAMPFIGIVHAAGTVTTSPIQVDWGNGPGQIVYSGSNNLTAKVNVTVPGTVQSWNVNVNGTDLGQVGTFDQSTNTLTLTGANINISGTTVYGKKPTDPGHHIQRELDGKTWRHQGEFTDNISFVADLSTRDGSGISQYPGIIPDAAYDIDTGSPTYHHTPPNTDLWDNGDAKTRSWNADPPDSFYQGSDAKSGFVVSLSQVDVNTITPYDAVTSDSLPTTAVKVSVGPPQAPHGTPGHGDVQMKMTLDGTLTDHSGSCTQYGVQYELTTYSGLAEGRNYCMTMDTLWRAVTYIYQPTTVTVTYIPTSVPDLGSIQLTGPSCIQVGQAAQFTLTFNNNGQDTSKTFNVQVLVDGSDYKDWTYNGMAGGSSSTQQFAYTFSSSVAKSFTVSLDSGNVVTEETNRSDNTQTFSFTPQSSCGGGGGPEIVVADFTIQKSVINFGDSNSFQPSVSVTGGNGCALQTITWTVSQGSATWTASNTQASSQGFSGPPYPGGIGVGSVSVIMKVLTTCGTTKTVGPKTFTIQSPPSCSNDSSPPVFKAGFVYHGNSSAVNPLSTAFPNDWLDLQIIYDSNASPSSPSDPDGDGFYFTWDWSGAAAKDAWLNKYYSNYNPWTHDERFSFPINMTLTSSDIGTHSIDVYATDFCGKTSKVTASIDVMEPNPIPNITLPPKVVEGRTVSPPIKGSGYSPKGYAIVSYDWHNTYSTYYATAGDYTIMLDVCDSAGLCSLAPDVKKLTVQPDLPPIVQLVNPGTGLRGNQMIFIDTSYSPDGDPISEHTDQLTCDTNNNGSYADETTTYLSPDRSGNIYFTPSRIGNCKVHVHIREGLGYMKSDDKDFYFKVDNDNPTASFSIQGQYQPPALSLPTAISTDALLSGSWKLTSLDGTLNSKPWYKTSSGTLRSFPVYDVPLLPNGQSPLNGLDMTKPYSIYNSTNNLTYEYYTDQFHTIPDSYWNHQQCTYWPTYSCHTDLPPYPFSDVYGLRLDQHAGAMGYVTGSAQYTSLGVWWGSETYTFTKTVDGVQQWQISETWWTGDPSRGIPASDPTVRAVSPDGQYFAYTRGNLLVLRRTSDGTEYGNFDLGGVYKVVGSYNNLIFISSGKAYDFNGNLVWTSNMPQCFALNAGYPSARYVISKDGMMYCGRMVSDYSGNHSVYLDEIDLSNGQLVAETFVNSFYYNPSSNDYYGDLSFIHHVNLVEDGGIVIGTVTDYMSRNSSGGSDYPVADLREAYIKGSTRAAAKREPYFTFGQFNNGSNVNQNGEYAYSFKFISSTKPNETAGFSFRMADNLNFYRVEHDSNTTSLVAYVNGSRSVIQSKSFPIAAGIFYNAKIKLSANHIKVYVNGSLVIDVLDSTLTAAGMYGPYTTKANTELKNITVLDYPPTAYLNNVIVVGNPIQYNTSYTDPENDPVRAGSVKWTFTNQQPYMYLDAGDGFSDVSPTNSYNNQVVTTPNAAINKVGYFKIDYQAADDPSPPPYTYADGTFSSYSKYSDPYTQYAKVVRVPIAKFTPYVNPDNSFGYTDQSYDPDRCYNAGSCQAGYGTSHGIFDRRWKYTAPDGTTSYGFPARPSQSGTYVISEAVMQEDGVWSDWYDQTINAAVPVPNQPPVATLTFPNGTQASPSYVSSLTPTITWNQTDPDPVTTFAAFQVAVRDPLGNLVIDSAVQPQASAATTAQWTISAPLTAGQTYQVQVRVFDGIAWSAWSNIGWFVTNRPPSAVMTYPSGTPGSPTIVASLRPTFTWSQSDPDPGTMFTYFELQVWDENNAKMLLTSGQHWQGTTAAAGSWTADIDLPARQKLRVRVRVFDGSVWSAWSSDTWFLINRPPLADFDWQPKPVWEGDNLRFTNRSQDPDGDPLWSTWQIRLPDGSLVSYATQDATALPPALPGTYDVTLTVTDGFAAASVTKSIVVAPLTIDAEVTYTPEWLAYHERHGHQTVSDPKDFYSGEIFVVRAVSSPVPVVTVQAWIDTLGKDGSVLQANTELSPAGIPYHYAGELFNQSFQSLTSGLPEGMQTIHFRIRYANGVDKTQDIPVNIIGPVLETVGVHRRQ